MNKPTDSLQLIRLAALKSWLKRKHDKGIHPNADAIWTRIKFKWANLTEAMQEELYQNVP